MTVIAAALKHMLAAGMPAEAIVAAVAEMEAALPTAPTERVRSKGAERQARYMERKRHKASQSVTNDADDVISVTDDEKRHSAPLPLSPNENNSNPHTPAPEHKTAPARKAHDLPDGWVPAAFGPATKCRAIVDGWPPGELETQIEHFAAHHRSHGNRFKDWQDAWKTWVLNSRNFGRSHRVGAARHHGGPDRRDGFDRACDRAIERADREAGRYPAVEAGSAGSLAIAGPAAL